MIRIPLAPLQYSDDLVVQQEFKKLSSENYYILKGLLDKDGKPRLYEFRRNFLKTSLNLELLIDCFNYWVTFDEFLVLKGTKIDKKYRVDSKYFAVKCSKRGNDVYNRRIKKKLDIINMDEDIKFFNYNDENPTTRAVMGVLTYDTKKSDINFAWENVGKEFNKYLSGLRRKFGYFEKIRSWESFENGYPHIHFVIIFYDKEFRCFANTEWNKSTKEYVVRFRLHDKAQFENWHSFVDIQGVRTVKDALKYITKEILKVHLFKDTPTKKYNRTLALMWFYRKRSFSISRGFIDLIRRMRNSNKKKDSKQVDLAGLEIMDGYIWQVVGIFSQKELGLKDNTYFSVIPNEIASKLPRRSKKKVRNKDHKKRVPRKIVCGWL